MKISAKVIPFLSRLCHASCVSVLVTLAGCAHAPIRQATAELDLTSTREPPPGVVAPVPLRPVSPALPSWLYGRDGVVHVQCTVDPDGWVWDVRAPDATDPDLAQYAMDAISRWQFAPGTRNGQPVAMRVSVPFQLAPQLE